MRERRSSGATFLVEVYMGRSGQARFAELSVRAAVAAGEPSASGTSARFVRAHFVPEDETCFYIFVGDSEDLIADVCRRAGIAFDRIVEAIAVDDEPPRQREPLTRGCDRKEPQDEPHQN